MGDDKLPDLTALLLRDAHDSVRLDPTCQSAWHLLGERLKVPDVESSLAGAIVAALRDWRPVDAVADSLRLTFLGTVCGDSVCMGDAARAAIGMEPPNPDRLATLAALAWASALCRTSARVDFIRDLQVLALPELAAALRGLAARHLATVPGLVAATTGALERPRVAVVAPYLADEHHTPSQLVARLAHVLADLSLPVHVFSAQELIVDDPMRFNGGQSRVLLAPLSRAYWQHALPDGVSLSCSDTRLTLNTRWKAMFRLIEGFKPDVVLFCGVFSPMAAALHARVPVAAINLHALLPVLSDVDAQLTAAGDADELGESPWAGTFTAGSAIHFPYRVQRPAPAGAPQLPAALPADAFCWISVGYRLAGEMPTPWLERLRPVLQAHPQVHWLLVGIDTVPNACSALAPGRVHALGVRNDVPALLARAKVYVNPPRVGGGFSVAEAMAAGLPVVSYQHCDGGDKLGELAVSSPADYVELLTQLTIDPSARRKMSATLRHRFDTLFDLDRAGPALKQALYRAIELAAPRLRRSHAATAGAET